MNIEVLLWAAGVSAGISGIVSFSLRTVIKAAIENRYKVELEEAKKRHSLELEQLRSELATGTNVERALLERRMNGYPKLVTLVHSTKKMCGDVAKGISAGEGLSEHVRELEETLYEFRIDLHRDAIFHDVHKYKNVAINFGIRAADVKYFEEKKEPERARGAQLELTEIYDAIEEMHVPIIDQLSAALDSRRTP